MAGKVSVATQCRSTCGPATLLDERTEAIELLSDPETDPDGLHTLADEREATAQSCGTWRPDHSRMALAAIGERDVGCRGATTISVSFRVAKPGAFLHAESFGINPPRRFSDERRHQVGLAQRGALMGAFLAAHFSAVAAAMKNVVQGYGERFVVPPSSVLDDLAEGYGHAEAGAALKAARAASKQLAKAGLAAACDYVEADRRATACAFVLEAFDGKAETLFSEVKAENYGTLAQELPDAAALTNNPGRAFRHARVTPQYLDAKRAELRWASAVIYLKATAREEQRLLKEQMREEEKAQRELERVKQEAEKDVSAIRKALEKAESSFAKASDVQRLELKAKIHALQGQLQTAEEKNKRAISMAQQTKKGNVYVISNVGSFGEHVYKIGLTRRLDPLDRIRELRDASVPFEFDVHALIRRTTPLPIALVRNQIDAVGRRRHASA